MKITTKTTREHLIKFIGANVPEVKQLDNELYEKIAYADKMMKNDSSKVTRTDLVSLAKSIIKLLGDNVTEVEAPQTTPTAENSVKLNGKKKASGEPKKEAEKKADTEKAEKTVKKTTAKKTSKKEESSATDSTDGTVPNSIFPEKLTVDGKEFVLAKEVKSIDDLYDLYVNDVPVICAFYWTKTHLKQYPYFNGVMGNPKSFKDDLDLATTFYVSPNKKIAYHLSNYTEGCYNTLPEEFEEIDGIRYAGGMEYQIYKAV